MFELMDAPIPEAGSTIAIVCPSAPAVAAFPHRVERGIGFLHALGFETRVMPNASLQTRWTAGSGRQRADDINAAFADPDISVVLAAIGGNHSAQLLGYLDYDLITSNPKVFQGYSDITTLHWALQKRSGLRTFYGPALVTELGEFPEVFPYTKEWLLRAWSGDTLDLDPANQWTDEFLDWNEQKDLERPREMRRSDGWRCLREGTTSGRLIGGCLETIMWHVRGTDIWTDPTDAILMLETSEEAPSPGHIDGYLTTLERGGVFDQVGGLIVGRGPGYSDDQRRSIWEVIQERTEASGIPVLAEFDIGHTDPMLTLPLGRHTEMDAGAATVRVAARS